MSSKRARRGPTRDLKARRTIAKRYEGTVRTCCPTNRARPHADDCRRAYRQCGDKVAFSRRDKAMKRAGDLSESTGEAWSAYRCRECRQWHIGHDAPSTS